MAGKKSEGLVVAQQVPREGPDDLKASVGSKIEHIGQMQPNEIRYYPLFANICLF